MRTFLTLEEAWEETLRHAPVMGVEEVPLEEAYQRVLAEAITSLAPMPPFDRSAMDGYAVRAADVEHASPTQPAVLELLEEVPAGRVPEQVVGAGQATRILTGAPMPSGADAVVRQEQTKRVAGAMQVQILAPVPLGEAISRQGEDAPQGALLLAAGQRIGAAETAVLASNGESRVRVYRRPRVGILVSGEEVQAPAVELQPGQIHDSNGPMLAALVQDAGGVPVLYGRVGDQLQATADLVRQAARECDVVLTTGGVSVGDYDLMREAYVQAGGAVHFWKVAIRPGTPVTFAQVGETPVFGLSGNPAAAFVNFVLLVQPFLRKMAGLSAHRHRPLLVELANDVEARVIGLDRFLRAHLRVEDGRLQAVVPGRGQKAAILTSLLNVQGFVRIKARTTAQKGERVEVYLLPSWA